MIEFSRIDTQDEEVVVQWQNGPAGGTPISAINLNKVNNGTAVAINNFISELETNLEKKSYIKKYNNSDAVVSSVECNDNEVRVSGKDLKVDNNIELNRGKSVFTDYLSSKNNQNGIVNGKITDATNADTSVNVSGTIDHKDITGPNGIFENDGKTAKTATNAIVETNNNTPTGNYFGLRKDASTGYIYTTNGELLHAMMKNIWPQGTILFNTPIYNSYSYTKTGNTIVFNNKTYILTGDLNAAGSKINLSADSKEYTYSTDYGYSQLSAGSTSSSVKGFYYLNLGNPYKTERLFFDTSATTVYVYTFMLHPGKSYRIYLSPRHRRVNFSVDIISGSPCQAIYEDDGYFCPALFSITSTPPLPTLNPLFPKEIIQIDIPYALKIASGLVSRDSTYDDIPYIVAILEISG